MQRLVVWLNSNEKIGHEPSPNWGKHTLILRLQLKRRLRRGQKYFYSYFTSFGTLIFGVMLAEREQWGKVEGEEGTSCEMTAWLRALSKTEAWTRWEQDKKVEAERVNQYMTRSTVVTCVVCLLDGMICWKVKVPLRSDWKSTYHEEVSWWSTVIVRWPATPLSFPEVINWCWALFILFPAAHPIFSCETGRSNLVLLLWSAPWSPHKPSVSPIPCSLSAKNPIFFWPKMKWFVG